MCMWEGHGSKLNNDPPEMSMSQSPETEYVTLDIEMGRLS